MIEELYCAVVDTQDGRCFAGEVREIVIAGAGFLRVTLPAGGALFFRGDALASITPCAPEFAQRASGALSRPLDHVVLPDGTRGDVEVQKDDVIYQAGWEDGYNSGWEEGQAAAADDLMGDMAGEQRSEARREDRPLFEEEQQQEAA